MMATRGNAPIGRDLCEAFGLDATKIRRLTLDVDSGDVVSLVVEILPDDEELRRAASVVARYKFVVELP